MKRYEKKQVELEELAETVCDCCGRPFKDKWGYTPALADAVTIRHRLAQS